MAEGKKKTYGGWLSAKLAHHADLARRLLEHRGEKGRVLEAAVREALRAVLPHRFSIGSGFVVTRSGGLSSQLDIVIYDHYFNAPILLDGGTGVFPVECVYGWVEVKMRLDGAALDQISESASRVRALAKEKMYVVYPTTLTPEGKPVVGPQPIHDGLAPRSFALALEAPHSGIQTLRRALADAAEKHGAHLHGVAVLKNEWFFTQLPHKVPYEFECATGSSLTRFCAAVLHTINSFPMLPASSDEYLEL